MSTTFSNSVGQANYIIFQNGSKYYAQNSQTGIVTSNAVLNTLVTSIMTALSTGGAIYLKECAFDLTLLSSIPRNVQIICNVGEKTFTYINSLDSSAPYTISIGSGVNNGYFVASDINNRIAYVSTDAEVVINNVTSLGTVKLPQGTISIDAPIHVYSNTRLIGAGRTLTTITPTGNFNAIEVEPDQSTGDLELRGFLINMGSYNGHGIYASSILWGSTLNNIGINYVASGYCGIKVYGVFLAHWQDIQMLSCAGTGIHFLGRDGSGIAYGNSAFRDIYISMTNGVNTIGMKIEGVGESKALVLSELSKIAIFGGQNGGIGIEFLNNEASYDSFNFVQLEGQNISFQSTNSTFIDINGNYIKALGTLPIAVNLINSQAIHVSKCYINSSNYAIQETYTLPDYVSIKNSFIDCQIYNLVTYTPLTELINCRLQSSYTFTVDSETVVYDDSLLFSDEMYSGNSLLLSQGETTHYSTFGTVEYMSAAGTVFKANASSITTMPVMGMQVIHSSATDWMGGNVVILTKGIVRHDSWNWVVGQPLYVSASTAGTMTQTKPTGSGNVIQVVGYAITPTIIYFNPSSYTIVYDGTATVTAGNTYVDVTHGIAVTPDIDRIKLVPEGNLLGREIWVSDVGATTFRINLSTLDTISHVIGWSYSE